MKIPAPAAALLAVLPLSGSAGERPNILWITAEDMSPTLGCYGDAYATTPHLDAFAATATRYDKAFAVSPVCSPSRASLITGVHNVTLGTNQMRSSFALPSGVRGFPAYLREAGYFTTNNVKTDYNTADAGRLVAESWDENSPAAHWRSAARVDGQPFFAVFNLMTSHQSRSMTWPYPAFEKHVQAKLSPGEVHDPAGAPLPPYYPDTGVVRRTVARYHDCVTSMDKEAGAILEQLEEDGLEDDTIVFFYSDHGAGMPRGKRLLHDSGMRVALLVHVPERWEHLRPTAPGGSTGRLVNFLDLPPSVLELAGLGAPAYMQGASIFGERERRYCYGSRDRVDEAYETSRSLRDGRWLYIRNYRPHLGWMQPSVFSDLSEIRRELRGLSGEVAPAVEAYVRPWKPEEEFYDCEEDPHNVRNLAGTRMAPMQSEAYGRMVAAFLEERARLRDLGAIPETEMRRWVEEEGRPIGDILAGEADHRPDLEAAWAAADKVGWQKPAVLLELLAKGDAPQRHWAAIALRTCFGKDPEVPAAAVDHLDDLSPAVRIEVASWLGIHERFREAAVARLLEDLSHEDEWVQLQACRAIELLGDNARAALPAMRDLYRRARQGEGDANLFLAFSSGAFLERYGEETQPWDFTPQ